MGTMTIAMVIVFSTLLTWRALSSANKDRHRALQDVSALMEQIAIMPLTTIGATFVHDQYITDFNDLHARSERVKIRYANGNPNAVPLNYDVIATWTTVAGETGKITMHGVRSR